MSLRRVPVDVSTSVDGGRTGSSPAHRRGAGGRSGRGRARARARRPARTRRRPPRPRFMDPCSRTRLVEQVVELASADARPCATSVGIARHDVEPREAGRRGMRASRQHGDELALGVEVRQQAAEVALVGAVPVHEQQAPAPPSLPCTTFVTNAIESSPPTQVRSEHVVHLGDDASPELLVAVDPHLAGVDAQRRVDPATRQPLERDPLMREPDRRGRSGCRSNSAGAAVDAPGWRRREASGAGDREHDGGTVGGCPLSSRPRTASRRPSCSACSAAARTVVAPGRPTARRMSCSWAYESKMRNGSSVRTVPGPMRGPRVGVEAGVVERAELRRCARW